MDESKLNNNNECKIIESILHYHNELSKLKLGDDRRDELYENFIQTLMELYDYISPQFVYKNNSNHYHYCRICSKGPYVKVGVLLHVFNSHLDFIADEFFCY
jgi:hypothetical protein